MGEGGRTVRPRGRALSRCWVIYGWVPAVGCWRTTPPHHSPENVCACHWEGAEGSRDIYPPRLSAWPAKAEPRGRCTCCPASGVPNLLEGDLRPLPWDIPTQKAAWPTALQAQLDGRGHQRHPVFPEEPFTKTRGYCHVGGGQKGGCHGSSMAQLPNRILPLVLQERLPTWWSPLGGQGGSPVGIRGCPHAGVKYWQTEPGSGQCPMLMPLQPQLPLG